MLMRESTYSDTSVSLRQSTTSTAKNNRNTKNSNMQDDMDVNANHSDTYWGAWASNGSGVASSHGGNDSNNTDMSSKGGKKKGANGEKTLRSPKAVRSPAKRPTSASSNNNRRSVNSSVSSRGSKKKNSSSSASTSTSRLQEARARYSNESRARARASVESRASQEATESMKRASKSQDKISQVLERIKMGSVVSTSIGSNHSHNDNRMSSDNGPSLARPQLSPRYSNNTNTSIASTTSGYDNSMRKSGSGGFNESISSAGSTSFMDSPPRGHVREQDMRSSYGGGGSIVAWSRESMPFSIREGEDGEIEAIENGKIDNGNNDANVDGDGGGGFGNMSMDMEVLQAIHTIDAAITSAEKAKQTARNGTLALNLSTTNNKNDVQDRETVDISAANSDTSSDEYHHHKSLSINNNSPMPLADGTDTGRAPRLTLENMTGESRAGGSSIVAWPDALDVVERDHRQSIESYQEKERRDWKDGTGRDGKGIGNTNGGSMLMQSIEADIQFMKELSADPSNGLGHSRVANEENTFGAMIEVNSPLVVKKAEHGQTVITTNSTSELKPAIDPRSSYNDSSAPLSTHSKHSQHTLLSSELAISVSQSIDPSTMRAPLTFETSQEEEEFWKSKAEASSRATQRFEQREDEAEKDSVANIRNSMQNGDQMERKSIESAQSVVSRGTASSAREGSVVTTSPFQQLQVASRPAEPLHSPSHSCSEDDGVRQLLSSNRQAIEDKAIDRSNTKAYMRRLKAAALLNTLSSQGKSADLGADVIVEEVLSERQREGYESPAHHHHHHHHHSGESDKHHHHHSHHHAGERRSLSPHQHSPSQALILSPKKSPQALTGAGVPSSAVGKILQQQSQQGANQQGSMTPYVPSQGPPSNPMAPTPAHLGRGPVNMSRQAEGGGDLGRQGKAFDVLFDDDGNGTDDKSITTSNTSNSKMSRLESRKAKVLRDAEQRAQVLKQKREVEARKKEELVNEYPIDMYGQPALPSMLVEAKEGLVGLTDEYTHHNNNRENASHNTNHAKRSGTSQSKKATPTPVNQRNKTLSNKLSNHRQVKNALSKGKHSTPV